MIVDDRPVYPPEFDEDPPCLICGRHCDDCPCPECPECGEKGNPECQGEHAKLHGLVWPLRVCPTCKGQKVTAGSDEHPGDPMPCPQCEGQGEILKDWPVLRRIGTPLRTLTKEERDYDEATERVAELYALLSTTWCVRCEGHGHNLSECPRRTP